MNTDTHGLQQQHKTKGHELKNCPGELKIWRAVFIRGFDIVFSFLIRPI